MLEASTAADEVRTAEVIGSLCLATDLAIGLPFEHGLQSTLVAMRLADRLGVDVEVASQTLLRLPAVLRRLHDRRRHRRRAVSRWRSARALQSGHVRLAGPDHARHPACAGRSRTDRAPVRAIQGAVRFPGAARGHQAHIVAMCEVAEMLSDRLACRAPSEACSAGSRPGGTARGRRTGLAASNSRWQ